MSLSGFLVNHLGADILHRFMSYMHMPQDHSRDWRKPKKSMHGPYSLWTSSIRRLFIVPHFPPDEAFIAINGPWTPQNPWTLGDPNRGTGCYKKSPYTTWTWLYKNSLVRFQDGYIWHVQGNQFRDITLIESDTTWDPHIYCFNMTVIRKLSSAISEMTSEMTLRKNLEITSEITRELISKVALRRWFSEVISEIALLSFRTVTCSK